MVFSTPLINGCRAYLVQSSCPTALYLIDAIITKMPSNTSRQCYLGVLHQRDFLFAILFIQAQLIINLLGSGVVNWFWQCYEMLIIRRWTAPGHQFCPFQIIITKHLKLQTYEKTVKFVILRMTIGFKWINFLHLWRVFARTPLVNESVNDEPSTLYHGSLVVLSSRELTESDYESESKFTRSVRLLN